MLKCRNTGLPALRLLREYGMTAAAHYLTQADPRLGAFIARIGPLRPRKREYAELYPALLSAIAHQQLHANAALAIFGRLKLACGEAFPTPAALLAMPDEALRACGFSASKTAAIRDVAAKSGGRHHPYARPRFAPFR